MHKSTNCPTGSTFGFYFRVRSCPPPEKDTDASSEDEEYDDMSLAQHATADVEARSRAASLAQSNEGEEFNQPHMKDGDVPTLSDQNSNLIPDSLINPETKLIPEAHPGVSTDNRMETTAAIADKISSPERRTANLVTDRDDEKSKGGEQKAAISTREKEPPQEKEPSQDKNPNPPRKSQNAVLLAEDNIVGVAIGLENQYRANLCQINQKVLTRQLKSKGYEVTPANNGKEAVAAVENSIIKTDDGQDRGKGPFDVILMDQEMPFLTGNAATKAIRKIEEEKHTEPMPILGVSANVREEQRKEMIESGMNDVITKPFKVDELVTRIKGLIEKW
jgi:CheY-like chemotaxis protein